jgi:hypothetical protein
MYKDSDSAVKSFSSFLPDAMTYLDHLRGDETALPAEALAESIADDDLEGGRLAA